ncbi:MAG: hypothetical protein E7273_10310 [Pseudobutyrivibrio ruminis]|nr:hypothetical protein [Pseudobutyrivibrio ruminis]
MSNTVNMFINVVAILAGLCLYIGVMNSSWGKKHQEYMYAIMLGTIIFAVIVGGVIRWLVV